MSIKTKVESKDILYIKDVGVGDPIILIHGFGSNSYSWRHLVPVLLNKYRVITIDLKGFGKSKKPYDNNYSIYDQATLIYSLIEKLNLDNITIIGHSYGGGVTLATMLLSKEHNSLRIKRLVLISSIAYQQEMPLFIKILRIPIIGNLGLSILPPEFQTRSILKLAYYDNSLIPEESIIEYAKALHTSDGKYATKKIAEQIVPDDIDEFSEKYKTITEPVLIIWGYNDKIVPIEIGKKLHKNINNSHFYVVKDGGHIPHEEKPEATIELIKKFMEP